MLCTLCRATLSSAWPGTAGTPSALSCRQVQRAVLVSQLWALVGLAASVAGLPEGRTPGVWRCRSGWMRLCLASCCRTREARMPVAAGKPVRAHEGCAAHSQLSFEQVNSRLPQLAFTASCEGSAVKQATPSCRLLRGCCMAAGQRAGHAAAAQRAQALRPGLPGSLLAARHAERPGRHQWLAKSLHRPCGLHRCRGVSAHACTMRAVQPLGQGESMLPCPRQHTCGWLNTEHLVRGPPALRSHSVSQHC